MEDARQTTGTERKSFSITKTLLWVLSILGSAVLTAVIKDYWEQARPTIQVTNFNLESAAGARAEIELGPELVHRIANHAYLPDVEIPITVEDLRGKLKTYARTLQVHSQEVNYINQLLSLLRSQSPAIELASRRHEFLQQLENDPNDSEIIESTVKIVAYDLESTLGAQCQHHPPGTEKLTVNLAAGIYDLSELNEDAIAADAGRRQGANSAGRARLEAHRTNIYRRLLVYYDQNQLVTVYGSARDYLVTCNRDAESIIAALTKKINEDARMTLDVLISNRGQRPAAIRALGVLRLEVPSADSKKSVQVMIPLGSSTTDVQKVVVVDGGKAETLHLLSRKSLAELIQEKGALLGGDNWTASKPLDESRLMLLFKARTGQLSASVSLARAGAKPQDAGIGPSPPVPVSESATEQTIEAMMKEMR